VGNFRSSELPSIVSDLGDQLWSAFGTTLRPSGFAWRSRNGLGPAIRQGRRLIWFHIQDGKLRSANCWAMPAFELSIPPASAGFFQR
jgi:hypothetical protein